MNKTEVRAILDGNKAQMHCPYCDALISFRVFANKLLDPEGPTCKHLDDWSHKGEVVKAHFKQGKETAMSERRLNDILNEIGRIKYGIPSPEGRAKIRGLMDEARAIGEKMQAEIVELKVAALEAGSKEKVANVYESAVKREEKNHLNSVISNLQKANIAKAEEVEKLKAEINALRGGIEAHKVEAERRAAVRENGRRRLIIYADSDRKMHVECPHCGKAITSDGPKLVLYDNDVFECVKCGERIVIADILGGTQYATASLSMDVAKQQDFHTASCVFLPVHINGLMRGHARLPIIGHCVDPDGCAVIVRLGKVDFPLPVDFDPSK